jgi:site-specific DNA-methyltransferase (adenine-specific)
MINLLHGDCLEQMKTLPDNSVDSIVTDPPYGISFMSKKWDYDVPKVEVWKEAMRVLKHGGHALIACGTRTQHRMVVNIEDAGFEIRDVVSWIYGSGFPKSLNISKAIDKAAGAEREVVGKSKGAASQNTESLGKFEPEYDATAPATDAAKQWDGWGTALKPACEFFTLARKPLSEKTVAANVLKWGTGGINIDGCRVGTEGATTRSHQAEYADSGWRTGHKVEKLDQGRFPANLIHDGSQQVLELFPETKPSPKATRKKNSNAPQTINAYGQYSDEGRVINGHNDKGSAARFFYCPKASKKDRDEGLEGFEEKRTGGMQATADGSMLTGSGNERITKRKNTHPTVKPTALMQYLCRLITPTGGVVLDPYMGSGSTGKAAVQEGFSFVGCELDKDYFDIATARVTNEKNRQL